MPPVEFVDVDNGVEYSGRVQVLRSSESSRAAVPQYTTP